MEHLCIQGSYHPNALAEALTGKKGETIPKGEATGRIQISDFDHRLFIKAIPFQEGQKSGPFTKIDETRYLPIQLKNSSKFLIDIEDFMRRMQIKEEKLEYACASQEHFEALITKRAGYLHAIDDFTAIRETFLKAAKEEEVEKHHFPTFDPAFPQAFSAQELMKVLRVSRRLLANTDTDTASLRVDERCFLVQNKQDQGMQVTMWQGETPFTFQDTHFLGQGHYSKVFKAFDLTQWCPSALKISKGRNSYQQEPEDCAQKAQEHLKKEFECINQLHDLKDLEKTALVECSKALYPIVANEEDRIATLWPRYTNNLMQLIDGTDEALPKLENFTRLEMLKMLKGLFESGQMLIELGLIYGDHKPHNVLCSDLGGLHLRIGDFGSCRWKKDVDLSSQEQATQNKFATIFTPFYASSDDLIELKTLSIACLALDKDSDAFLKKQVSYFKILEAREALSLGLLGYQLLGYYQDWHVDQYNCVNFFVSFDRFPCSQNKAQIERKKHLYGEKIHTMFEGLITQEWRNRYSLASAIDMLAETIHEAESNTEGPLHTLLSKKYPTFNLP